MIRVSDTHEGKKAKENLKNVSGLAKEVFSGFRNFIENEGKVFVYGDDSMAAIINPETNSLILRNPIYAEYVNRFSEAFETAFLQKNEKFTIRRDYI